MGLIEYGLFVTRGICLVVVGRGGGGGCRDWRVEDGRAGSRIFHVKFDS